jgi:hypothetical protein
VLHESASEELPRFQRLTRGDRSGELVGDLLVRTVAQGGGRRPGQPRHVVV